MPQPPWFVRLGHGKLMLGWMVGVAVLAGLLTANSADLQARPAEVVTETVRVREIVTEHHTAEPSSADLAAEAERLRRLRRTLRERREELAALRAELDSRRAELEAREADLVAPPR